MTEPVGQRELNRADTGFTRTEVLDGSQPAGGAADSREAARASDVQLLERELRAEQVHRTEVRLLLGAGRLVLRLQGRQDEPGQVPLEARVGRVDRDPQLLEHLLAVGRADQRRETGVLQLLLDLQRVVRHRRGDLRTGAREHLVGGVVEAVTGIPQRTGVRGLHHAGRQREATASPGESREQECRVASTLHPARVPGVELSDVARHGRPQVRLDPREQLLLATGRDVVAVEAGDRREDVAVVATGDLVAQLEVAGVDRVVVRLGEPLHLGDQLVRDVVQADTRRQRHPDGSDDGRGVDLENTTGAQRIEPRAVLRDGRQDVVGDGRVDGGGRGLRRESSEELTRRDRLHAGHDQVRLVQQGQARDVGDAEGVLDVVDDGLVDPVLEQLGRDLVGRGGRVGSGGCGVRSDLGGHVGSLG